MTTALVVLALLVAAALLASVFIATAYRDRYSRKGKTVQQQTHPTAPAAPLPTPGIADRASTLISAHDQANTHTHRDRLVAELADLGVYPVPVTVGDAFDPTVHKAVHTSPPTAAHLEGTVAELVRLGWSGPAGMIRYAEVTVYTSPSS